ncbi:MAG TPA: hypothetical protein VK448_12210 [Dissulfurispiraceae bacterium]|nr:hypothetical protein [Dissulfurispiraceae bacterium]
MKIRTMIGAEKYSVCGRPYLRSLLIVCLFVVIFFSPIFAPRNASAHGIAGNRFFPTTFTVDDPFISDEFSLLVHHNKQSGDPSSKQTDISIDYSKRLFPNFGFEFHEAYMHQKFSDGSSAHGWDNLGLGAKWQFLTDEKRELIMSVGTDFDIGGTGAHQVAESFSTITPMFFFGKGLGDLPGSVNFLRPLAVTGALGVSFPTRSRNVHTVFNEETGDFDQDIEHNSKILNWGFTVQYSLMYLQQHVKDIGLPDPFKRMILVVEFPMQTNLSRDNKGLTTGTINPGIVWAGKSFEFGIAAELPVNARSGKTVGILGLIHFFLDDLFPGSIGSPIFH